MEIIRQKEETLIRKQRMQIMKEKQDKENKLNQKQYGKFEEGQQEEVTFKTEDHTRIIEIKGYIKQMTELVKDQLRNMNQRGPPPI